MNEKQAAIDWQAIKDWGQKTWAQNKEPIVGGLLGAGLGGGLGTYLGATGPQDPEEKHPILGPALTGAILGGLGGSAFPYGLKQWGGGQGPQEKAPAPEGVIPKLMAGGDKALGVAATPLTTGTGLGVAGATLGSTILDAVLKGKAKGPNAKGPLLGPVSNLAEVWDAIKTIQRQRAGLKTEIGDINKKLAVPPAPAPVAAPQPVWAHPAEATAAAEATARQAKIHARVVEIANKLREERLTTAKNYWRYGAGERPSIASQGRRIAGRSLKSLLAPAIGAWAGHAGADILKGQGE